MYPPGWLNISAGCGRKCLYDSFVQAVEQSSNAKGEFQTTSGPFGIYKNTEIGEK
jgi:hypothetical protein